MAKRLVILDGYSLLYRAFFATRYMSTSDGRPTNALYGFIGMLFYILEHDEPEAVVVALDAPGKTFRHAEYAEYKGTRRETADELVVQLKESRNLIAALGIPSIEVTGYEADDVVGTISHIAEENGYNTTIVTGDLDSLQLVDPCVTVMTSKQGVTDVVMYGPKDVQERYGFAPEFIPDYKAIVGDTSDNIPGVPGIGDKGATTLIQQFGSIENMLDKWDEIDPKFQKKIEPVREQMLKSKWLATIKRDAPISYDFKPFRLNEEQFEAARAFFELYELRAHARRMPLVLGKYLHGFERGVSKPPSEIKNETLEITLEESDSFEELRSWIDERPFALYFDSVQDEGPAAPLPANTSSNLFDDAEAQATQPASRRIAYVAVGKAVRLTTEKAGNDLFRQLPNQTVLHDAKPLYKKLLAEKRSLSETHNAQRATQSSGQDSGLSAQDSPKDITPKTQDIPSGPQDSALSAQDSPNAQRTTNSPRFDTAVAGFVLQSGRSNYALRDLVQGYLEITPPTTGAEMSAALSLLEPAMRDRIVKESQTKVLEEIELPLIPVLAQMENHGILVDPTVLSDFSVHLQIEVERTARCIFETAGLQFNIGSPKQLGDILFERLQIPGPKKGKTGYGTGAEVLQPLAATNPICADILSWRELSKLRSTYAEALPKLIGKDGRIHTTYSQTGAATGRLSSNEPNLQNIPTRTELGRNIRRAFIAAPGYKLASFDYSQIELRILAHMCGDENLLKAFEDKQDIHAVTASLMWNMLVTDISKEQRGYAKTLNFAVLYGSTEWGLVSQLGGGFSVTEAKALIDQYRERFPKVKAFTDSIVAEARSKGFTTTLSGRRRYFPDIHNANRNERMASERQAMNAPIQGTASDMLKLAMIKVAQYLADENARTRMLLTVHDELLFELAEGEDRVVEPIRAIMENALELSVPVEVDLKVGHSWDEMTKVGR